MSIQVLIVDDSAVVRQVLSDILSREAGIGPVETAPDPLFAMEKMKANWPDVVVLDVEMPRMDGISFLQKIMATRPTPVVICSSLAASGTYILNDLWDLDSDRQHPRKRHRPFASALLPIHHGLAMSASAFDSSPCKIMYR